MDPVSSRGMTTNNRWCVLRWVALVTASCSLSMMGEGGLLAASAAEGPVVRFETRAIRAVVADNSAYSPMHRAGYNGLAELRLGSWEAPNLFVPFYAGLNFERLWFMESVTGENLKE